MDALSDHEYEQRTLDAHIAAHPPCSTCGEPACMVGEQGLTDECDDDELGIRLGGTVVHNGGECKAAHVALLERQEWERRTLATIARAEKVFRCFEGRVLTKGRAGFLSALLWSEFPELRADDAESLCYPEILRGQVITARDVADRARQVATVVLGYSWARMEGLTP